MDCPIQVGIAGTGHAARGLALLLSKRHDLEACGVITRRKDLISDLYVDPAVVFNQPERVFEKSDIVVVSTGNPVYSTEIISKAFEFDQPVVTMDADTLVVSGTWLAQKGVLTESDGDQPGCLAVLKNQVVEMGFTSLVYGNIKGFLNKNPSRQDMEYWAARQDFSIASVTSFTDGTKLQIEQCLVANGLGASIACRGLIGKLATDLEEGAFFLAEEAAKRNAVLSDYIVSGRAPPGVFSLLAPIMKNWPLT